MKRTMVFVTLLLAFVGEPRAETGSVSTLEWLSCRAEVVVLGKIANVITSCGEGSVVYEDCTIEIVDVIKGTSDGDEFEFTLRTLSTSPTLERFTRSDRGLLVFLSKSKELARERKRSTIYEPTSTRSPLSVIDLDDLPDDLWTKERRVLEDPLEVLAITYRWASSEISQAIRQDQEFGLAAGTPVNLVVPAEDTYRVLLLAMAHSNDAQERRSAALELSKFPGPETEASLRNLLADSTEDREFYAADSLVGIKFGVREAAKTSLEALGKPVPDIPVGREPTMEERREVRHTYWRDSFRAALVGEWRVVSVDDGNVRQIDGRETVAVIVTCGSGQERCTFTLIPAEWNAKDAATGELLGINRRDSQGARIFFLEGTLPTNVRAALVAYFGLELLRL